MAIYQAQNWKIVKFADKLKDIVCLLIGCTRQQLEDREFKEKELGEEWKVFYAYYCDGFESQTMLFNCKEDRDDWVISLSDSFDCRRVWDEILTPRKILQQVGTDLFRNQFHPNTWTNATFANYQDDNWIITDMRFPNELEAIKKHNGITIRINRGLVERTGKLIQEPEHISETALDDTKFDYIIENNGTIEELLEQVKKILIKEEII